MKMMKFGIIEAMSETNTRYYEITSLRGQKHGRRLK